MNYWIEKLWTLLWRCYKLILHCVTQSCEIERLCCKNTFHRADIIAVVESLRTSRQLSHLRPQLFGFKSFDINRAIKDIINIKKILPTAQFYRNLNKVLHCVNIINISIQQCDNLKQTNSNDHLQQTERLLNELWMSLKPNMKRSTEGLVSSDWSEIGFQGMNPTTDFRGMGMLGLIQLHYFARSRSTSAQSVLLESNHPRRYYPFAATGINVTSFVMELLHEYRLHRVLLQAIPLPESHYTAGSTPTAEEGEEGEEADSYDYDQTVVQQSMEVIHNCYSDIYEDFNKLWIQRDPPNIFSFQGIFQEIKNSYRLKYVSF